MRTWSSIFVVALAACGSDGGSKASPDAGGADAADAGAQPPDGGSQGSLRSALDDARKSNAELCGTIDRCYPDLVEENWCTWPSEGGSAGFQRVWPPAPADSCWDPIYAEHPRAALDILACVADANRAFASCMQSCPDDVGAGACADASDEREDACFDAFVTVVGEEVVDDASDCEDRLAPAPD